MVTIFLAHEIEDQREVLREPAGVFPAVDLHLGLSDHLLLKIEAVGGEGIVVV